MSCLPLGLTCSLTALIILTGITCNMPVLRLQLCFKVIVIGILTLYSKEAFYTVNNIRKNLIMNLG